MSRQFRSTFTLLFRPKFFDKWLPVAQDEEMLGRDVAGATCTAAGGVSQSAGRRCEGGGGGRTSGMQRHLIGKSIMGEQNFNTTTQVTNV